MIQYAEVGGHKTYLNSLDVRTVGIGGGSMVQLENGKAVGTARAAPILPIWNTKFTPTRRPSVTRALWRCTPPHRPGIRLH